MKISFKGNIGKDALLRSVQVGDSKVSVCDIWVAENIGRSQETRKTLWHKVTIWRKYAETMAQYMKTGRRIEVEGKGEAKAYTSKDGRIVPYIAVSDATIEFLDRRHDEPAVPEVEAEVETEEEATPWDD